MLRDRLVLGINEDRWQRRLLAEPDLTLEKTLKLVQAQELAAESCQLVSRTDTSEHSTQENVCILKENASSRRCPRCLSTRHLPWKCPFISKKCFQCSRVGHTAAACRLRAKNAERRRETLQLQAEAEADPTEEAFSLHQTKASQHSKVPPIKTALKVNNQTIVMEVDTGASTSLISSKTYWNELSGFPPLQPTSIQLRTYSGENIPVEGQVRVRVQVGEETPKNLNLLVVAGSGCSLLGRDWLKQLRLDWTSINLLRQEESMPSRLKELLDKYSAVFADGLGTFNGPPVSLKLKEGAQPRFLKARNVPFALKNKVDQQLQREINDGILFPMECSEYASPIVPVMKPDGKIRICADF